MANKKAAAWWTAGLVTSAVMGVVSLIGLAASDPDAAGTIIGAASRASKPRAVRKTSYDGLFSSYTVTEYL